MGSRAARCTTTLFTHLSHDRFRADVKWMIDRAAAVVELTFAEQPAVVRLLVEGRESSIGLVAHRLPVGWDHS